MIALFFVVGATNVQPHWLSNAEQFEPAGMHVPASSEHE
jgi:hypothetical protein